MEFRCRSPIAVQSFRCMLTGRLAPIFFLLPMLPLGCVVASPPNQGEQTPGQAGQQNQHGNGGNPTTPQEGSAGNSVGAGGTTTTGGRDAGKDSGGKTISYAPWVNESGDLLDKATPAAGEVFLLNSKPGEKRIIAGIGHTGLWETRDLKTWERIGVADGGAQINNLPTTIVYDPDDPNVFWESGSYGDGVFKTVDNGATFEHLGDSGHDEIVSVDFTDPKRKTLLVGPHEQRLKLFLSSNGGDTWTDIGPNLPPDSDWSTSPQIIDTKTFLLGSCGGGSAGCGVYRSTDGGQSWERTTTRGALGRALWASDGTLYWLLFGGGVIASTDKGVTWTYAQGPAYIQYGTVVELPDGRVVALGSDHLVASSDHGKTWKPIGAPLPYPGANCGIYGFTYSPEFKKFLLNHNNCSGMLLTDPIYTEDFDTATQ
jgi:photosystem II stability/assembly factor-like uncharacterized protein